MPQMEHETGAMLLEDVCALLSFLRDNIMPLLDGERQEYVRELFDDEINSLTDD